MSDAHIHEPAIVHRTGGVPAGALNVCGVCAQYIVPDPGFAGEWLAVSEVEADRIRETWRGAKARGENQ